MTIQKFGTFKGVFTPSILTILGVIMYLRLGWVVGHAGIAGALLIITMASAITFVTALSISATATNMKIGGGGAYYMISRSLGVEAGAAVGLPLYLAQAVGIAFYLAGFSESLTGFFPGVPQAAISLGTLVVLTILAYTSASLALKAQFVIFGMIILSLVSFFVGNEQALPTASTLNATEPSFWVIFAVFFPAVTGIEVGISMSGDLKNPARSLPWGTLAAVVTGYVVYMVMAFLLYQRASSLQLQQEPMIVGSLSWVAELVLLGLWGATLSSALGALLGAPRTLQALARDRVVPRVLGKGYGEADTPRIATAVSFIVASLGIVIGDLNAIAPILSMFFLTSYGILNFSAAMEGMIGNPSWRPSFRIPWYVSMLGAFACFAIMFMIDPGATFIAAFLSFGVYYFMQRREMRTHWGDMRRGILMYLARFSIYRLIEVSPNPRSWRPHIFVLSGSPTSRWYLIALADAITHGKGFLTVGTILKEDQTSDERARNIRRTIREYLRKRHVPALVHVQLAPDVVTGAKNVIRSYGIGSLVPNTVLLGETEKQDSFQEFVALMGTIYQAKRNLVIVREGVAPEPKPLSSPKIIDVWWGRERQNASLALVLGYMLQISPEWKGARLRLRTIVRSEAEQDQAEHYLSQFLATGRLDAEAHVTCIDPADDVFQVIGQTSRQCDLIFIGMRPHEGEETDEEYSRYYESILEKTADFPPLAIVIAAEGIEFGKIFV